eukprot:TRINITY_DN63_c0_g1_i4.p2 TRINITY_DN63_c0_g1~~TRINITY_DN63_c0_g1_i4.p2  ORF type:complete len:106 (-),score=7.33 TRINITY_DN63_c0_g1_i4:69-386(-)
MGILSAIMAGRGLTLKESFPSPLQHKIRRFFLSVEHAAHLLQDFHLDSNTSMKEVECSEIVPSLCIPRVAYARNYSCLKPLKGEKGGSKVEEISIATSKRRSRCS